jgi:hypothetical protein
MRKRRNVILGLAIMSWLAIACGSGVGALATTDDGYDSPPINRESPGPGREVPLTTRDVPPNSRDNPGTQGGGGGGGGGGSACPPCDVKFDCLIGGKQKSTINLRTANGQCSAGEGVTFDCNGKVIQNGAAIGTWSAGPGSSYTVNVTQQGTPTTLICTKATSTPVPTNTGTSTAPTGTVPPLDAGIRG